MSAFSAASAAFGIGECAKPLVNLARVLDLIGEAFSSSQQECKIIFAETPHIGNLLEDSFHAIKPRGLVEFVVLFHFISGELVHSRNW
jgi:hypothetical protein